MKSILSNKHVWFVSAVLLFSAIVLSNCSGGSGYVPGNSNSSVCSQSLSADMKKLLNCPTTPSAPPTAPTNTNLPPSIVVANSGVFSYNCFVPPTGSTIAVTVSATDFQTNESIPDSTINFFSTTSDTVKNNPPDSTVNTGSNGWLPGLLPTGIPVAVEGINSASGYKNTYQFGLTLSPTDANSIFKVLLISSNTVNLVTALSHVTQDWTNDGAIAGTVWDCSGNPIQNAIVTLVNAGTDVSVSANIIYFRYSSGLGDIPDPTLTLTSSDGIFLAFNVPPGDYDVIAQGVLPNGNALVELGRSYVESFAGSVSISNIQPETSTTVTTTSIQ
ncbi:MAG: carboxypeptidase-like regulatory domain-containing protein [Deltaproteobacteria bacterium]|nr:carboxypeptidase-like regulatory domain-containing protein [Deltaproteobacteria bacterium]MCL5791611.1 carboxypeptidase-like regulatory domain-containing protein [Deltaproteobacteria bacterium]